MQVSSWKEMFVADRQATLSPPVASERPTAASVHGAVVDTGLKSRGGMVTDGTRNRMKFVGPVVRHSWISGGDGHLVPAGFSFHLFFKSAGSNIDRHRKFLWTHHWLRTELLSPEKDSSWFPWNLSLVAPIPLDPWQHWGTASTVSSLSSSSSAAGTAESPRSSGFLMGRAPSRGRVTSGPLSQIFEVGEKPSRCRISIPIISFVIHKHWGLMYVFKPIYKSLSIFKWHFCGNESVLFSQLADADVDSKPSRCYLQLFGGGLAHLERLYCNIETQQCKEVWIFGYMYCQP